MSILDRSLLELKGVGSATAKSLSSANIHKLQDLLFWLPIRYVDKTKIHPIGTLLPDENAQIEGEVVSSHVIFKPKKMLDVEVKDHSGRISLRFFYFQSNYKETFLKGKRIRCFGVVKSGYNSKFQMIHPEFKTFYGEEPIPVQEYLTPIYPKIQGVSPKLLDKLITQVLDLIRPIKNSIEIIPLELLKNDKYPSLFDSIEMLHRPPPTIQESVYNEGDFIARKRLALEELLAYHISLKEFKSKQTIEHAPVIKKTKLVDVLLKSLPFTPTNAQIRVYEEIMHDMNSGIAMQRLVQGDVGSGKTLIALMATLGVVEADKQVAFMVPTEILAEQHFNNINSLLNKFENNISCELLVGKAKKSVKDSIIKRLISNEINIIIGTHALFQKDVGFNNLALIIIDEQHRFGVKQRLSLKSKGDTHQLILSATPIPRSLAMTFYADLDYSVIDEMPPNRKEISTLLISLDKKNDVIERIKKYVKTNHQVYWVCTLVEESETLQLSAAKNVFDDLVQSLPGIRVALVHGKMPSDEKNEVMHKFKNHQIDLLVATTVIEVGVDVPNANLMIIENAERLGLASLHQLRGRVGRGDAASFCILLYKSPLSETAKGRLDIMRKSSDGFVISEYDLNQRGPGDFFGARQSGGRLFKIANLVTDKDLISVVNKISPKIIVDYEKVKSLKRRWLHVISDFIQV